MSVTVELCGGPLDGQMVDLNTPPWAPPLTLRFPVRLPVASWSPSPDPLGAYAPPVSVAYDRHPSPDETGPVWRYVYRRPE